MNDYDLWAEIIKECGYKPILRPDEIIVDTKYTVISLTFFVNHLIGSKTLLRREIK